jgi:hypothetical protein
MVLSEREIEPISQPASSNTTAMPRSIAVSFGGLPTIAVPFEASWLEPVVRRMNYLLNLKEGWDSYGARPINIMSAHAVIRFISLFGVGVATPDVFPLANGNLQLEWDSENGSVEVEVASSGRVSFVASQGDGDHAERADISFDIFQIDCFQKVESLVRG